MNSKIKITELDFDTILNNLKQYMRSQNEFLDFDFDGSGIRVLLEVLAYNTHYNSYYLNTVANEAFMDTAMLRDSVVSHAKTLGYTPYSRTSAKALVNIQIPYIEGNPTVLTLRRGFSFKSELSDNITYNFCLNDDITATMANNSFYFNDINLYEGTYSTFNYEHDEQTNPKAIYRIPDKNIDTATLQVIVKESATSSNAEVYSLSTSIVGIDGDSSVFFIQEGMDQYYEIYFGNGFIGKKLTTGNIVMMSYISSSGDDGNKFRVFTAISVEGPYITYNVTTLSPSAGGAEREGVDSIKFSAISQYSSQDRLVSVNDFSAFLKNEYPNIDSISVWGGEDNIPRVYGKVFICIKPKDGYYLSETEKIRIIDTIILPKSVVCITPEMVDPEYSYILITTKVKYDKNRTILTDSQLRQAIREKIISYNSTTLNSFNARLISSRLQDEIDSTDGSILGNDAIIKVQKRVAPVFNTNYNYTVNFNLPLRRGSASSQLTSSEFTVYDNSGIQRVVTLEEIPNSDTGISSIIITDPGTGYTTTPTVTITGDGTGATAEARVVNGKVESITIINRGINYSKAVVNITGGGGNSAKAVAIISSQVGELRTVYFNNNAERVVINSKAGQINYDTGQITLTDINIVSVNDVNNELRISIEADSGIVEANRNTLLYIDHTDSTSIVVVTESI